MNTDNQLLAEYANHGSEGAFRELVQRHINMAHSAALREARGNVALAEDITQEVFTELARSADKLSSHPALAGWIYTCVRQMTANIRRAEYRRQRREKETFLMNELLGPNQDNQLWQQVRPVLDDVMHELDNEDRTAVVLRFFEGLSLKEVGVALSLTENAARMRVERSLEKLHVRLSRRGINSTASTLAAVLVAGAVLSASSTFAASVATGAMASAAAGHASAFSLAKVVSIVKSKTVLIGSVAILASGIVLWKHFEPQSKSVAPRMSVPPAPAVVSMDANDAAQAEPTPVIANAASTNPVVPGQMALQLADTDNGEPLPAAKLYLFYMFRDGRGKVEHAMTDGHGRAGVDMPQAPYWALNMFVTADGHVPKTTTFGFRRTMPSEYTMKLEHGVSIGGVVLDEEGRPIPNAKVGFDGPGNDSSLAENIQFGPDSEVVTDSNGQWSCNMIPKEYDQITLHVKDNEHAATNRTVRLAAEDANKLVITLSPGFSIKGWVEDLNGNPIADARVRQVRMNDEGDNSKATDASGTFEFKALGAGEFLLSVQADGFAPAVQTLQLTGKLEALKFQLGPGQILRGRIVDEDGSPVLNAFVETTRRGMDKIRFSTNTDANGRFEWNSAPTEPLLYSVLAEGFDRAYAQALTADGSEQVVKLTREHPEKDNVQVTGTVVDAETGTPLDGFKVFVGELDPQWAYPVDFFTTGKNGKFTVSFPAKSSHPGYVVQIERDGYLPGASPNLLKTNGSQKLEFKLHKGLGPAGVVFLPDGEPAVNASVLLCTSRAGVTMDELARVQKGINTTPYRTQTDSSGKFSIAAAIDPQGLIIVHDQGFAAVSLADLAATETIPLQPWGQVKGKLMNGSQPGTNESVGVHNQVIHYTEDGRHCAFLTYNLTATTDADGNFSFDNVPPGSCTVMHLQGSPSGVGFTSSSDNTSVTVTSGAVTEVVLGGAGSMLQGKATVPGNPGAIDWRKASVRLRTKSGNEPTSLPKREDFATFEAFVAASETYFHSYQIQKRFETFCDSDGSFRLANVAAGTYELKIEVRDSKENSAAPHQFSDPSPVLYSLVRAIVVPDDKNVEPLDLGTVELVPQQANVSAR